MNRDAPQLVAPPESDTGKATHVTITDTARGAINRRALASADGRETGGILLGHAPARPVPALDVVHAIGPGPRAVRRATVFRRDLRHAQAAADLAYHTDSSYWIGDWHTHPTGPPHPSSLDLTSYQSLLADTELDFAMFLAVIVTPDPVAGFRRPQLNGWLISLAGVRATPLRARLPEKDAGQ